MTQSPAGINITPTGNKPLVKGVGYTTVFLSDTIKIEVSTNGTVMRRTIYKNGNKIKEYLYVRIDNPDEIRRIENVECKWKTYDGEQYGYIVREQYDKKGNCNDYYKIVERCKVKIRREYHLFREKTITIDSDDRDWTYYKRRSVGK